MKKINYQNIEDNIDIIRDYNNTKKIIAVLKNDAYNLGLEPILKVLEKKNVDSIMLTDVEDVRKVRKFNKDINILIANPLTKDMFEEIKDENVFVIIDNYEYLINNLKYLKEHDIHLKINSSMNRFGIDNLDELNKVIQTCLKESINVVGIYTHFSLEDEDKEAYNNHVSKFKSMVIETQKYFNLDYIHSENSYTFLKKDSNLDFCNYARLGLLMYGYNSSNYKLKVKPSVFLTANIVKIRKVNKGETISYGKGNLIKEDSLIAICDIGYGNGLLRTRSNLPVHINGKKFNIFGKISMSHTYIKVDETVQVGDIVTFYDQENITVLDHAKVDDIPTSMIISYLN